MSTEITWSDPSKTTIKIGNEDVTFHFGFAISPESKVVLTAGINEYWDHVTAVFLSTETGKPEKKFSQAYASYAEAKADFEAWALDYQSILISEAKDRAESLGA